MSILGWLFGRREEVPLQTLVFPQAMRSIGWERPATGAAVDSEELCRLLDGALDGPQVERPPVSDMDEFVREEPEMYFDLGLDGRARAFFPPTREELEDAARGVI